jgi:hypothetical protein
MSSGSFPPLCYGEDVSSEGAHEAGGPLRESATFAVFYRPDGVFADPHRGRELGQRHAFFDAGAFDGLTELPAKRERFSVSHFPHSIYAFQMILPKIIQDFLDSHDRYDTITCGRGQVVFWETGNVYPKDGWRKKDICSVGRSLRHG